MRANKLPGRSRVNSAGREKEFLGIPRRSGGDAFRKRRGNRVPAADDRFRESGGQFRGRLPTGEHASARKSSELFKRR